MKKLKLKKKVISNLKENEMNQLKGGFTETTLTTDFWIYCGSRNCGTDTCGCTCGTAYTCNG